MTLYLEFRKEGGRELFNNGSVFEVLEGLEYLVKSRSRPKMRPHEVKRWVHLGEISYICSCEDFNKKDKNGQYMKRLYCIHIEGVKCYLNEVGR